MPENKKPKILIGKVVSDRMNKTAVVLVERYQKAPKYGKFIKISKHFKAHDENNEYRENDKVEIQETKPVSKEKRWKVVRLIERSEKLENEGMLTENEEEKK